MPLTVGWQGPASCRATPPDADLHRLAEELHELVFDLTLPPVLAHVGFHTWRHLRLRDNALWIMAQKLLHRSL
ncbi:MAG: hypothetical protein AAFU49_10315 [Pseudomonadota bacterium]